MSSLEKHIYANGDTRLTGWVARPEGTPRAGLVIYPTIANITPRVAQKAQALARAGYLVLVADYYGVQIDSFEQAQPLAKTLREDNTAYRQRLAAALSAMRALPDAAGLPLAAIGFCMGGQAALEMARAGEALAAVVTFHGILGSAQPAHTGDRIYPRILVMHGDADPMVPRAQVARFMEEMDAAGADWHLHIYSGVKHGFTDPASDQRALEAVAYNASADRQSWAAMHNFLNEIFGPPSR